MGGLRNHCIKSGKILLVSDFELKCDMVSLLEGFYCFSSGNASKESFMT